MLFPTLLIWQTHPLRSNSRSILSTKPSLAPLPNLELDTLSSEYSKLLKILDPTVFCPLTDMSLMKTGTIIVHSQTQWQGAYMVYGKYSIAIYSMNARDLVILIKWNFWKITFLKTQQGVGLMNGTALKPSTSPLKKISPVQISCENSHPV